MRNMNSTVFFLIAVLILSLLVRDGTSQKQTLTDFEQTCLRLGAPTSVSETISACSPHDYTLEDKFQNTVCEPSSQWLENFITVPEAKILVDACNQNPDQNLTNQTNQTYQTCPIAEEGVCSSDSNSSNCFTPSLLVLQTVLTSLVDSFPELEEAAFNHPLSCIQQENRSGCLEIPGCDWEERNSSLPIVETGCYLNETYRLEQLIPLGVSQQSYEALVALDEDLKLCAYGENGPITNRTDCERVQSKAEQRPSEIFDLYSFCAWRGNRDDYENKNSTEYAFNWGKVSYLGATPQIYNSQCTIQRNQMAERIMSLYALLDLDVILENILNNQNNSDIGYNLDVADLRENLAQMQLVLYTFERCIGETQVEKLPFPQEFLSVWQTIVVQIVYLCAGFYLVAGVRLAWVTRPELRKHGVKTIFKPIISLFLLTVMGGLVGFCLGAIPAAMLTTAIDTTSLTDGMIISLGYAIGFIIIYLDSGRT